MTSDNVLVLWDVDHTLIENGGASKGTYAEAFRSLVGHHPSVRPDTHGRTDFEIMANLLLSNGEDPTRFVDARVRSALVEAMESQRSVLMSKGYALPGAAEVLKEVAALPWVLQSVLTGNIPSNAAVKLGVFGLAKLLDLDVGGYGTDSRRRYELVDAAREKAHRKYGHEYTPSTTVLVGDTVRDVEAARLGHALIIAVATGTHSTQELREAGADVVMDDLVKPGDFVVTLRELLAR